MTDQNTPTLPPLLPRKVPLTNRERAIIMVNNFFDRYKDEDVDVEEFMELDTEDGSDVIKELLHSIHITRKF